MSKQPKNITIFATIISKDHKILEFSAISTNTLFDYSGEFTVLVENKSKDVPAFYEKFNKKTDRIDLSSAIDKFLLWLPHDTDIVANRYYDTFLRILKENEIRLPSLKVYYIEDEAAAKEDIGSISGNPSLQIARKNYHYLRKNYNGNKRRK
jgi:hypothetical protein